MALIVALSLVAAFLFAASAAMQQHAVRITPPPEPKSRQSWPSLAVPVLRLARKLTHSKLWWAGCAANVCGSFTQAAALHFGSVSIVQIVMVSQLLFTLPLGTAWDRRWPQRRDWLAAVAISGGLALFLAVPGAAPVEGTPDRALVALAVVCAAALVGVLVAIAARRPALVHATLVALAAGVCFAVSAVLMKVTLADLVGRGIPATARDWPGYALALANIGGFVLEQEAFAAGSLAAAVATMTITNPTASYFLGVLTTQSRFPTGAGPLAALTGAGALIAAGVIGLAHSPLVHRQPAAPAGATDPTGSARAAPAGPPATGLADDPI